LCPFLFPTSVLWGNFSPFTFAGSNNTLNPQLLLTT
jgi:hypothetical protein